MERIGIELSGIIIIFYSFWFMQSRLFNGKMKKRSYMRFTVYTLLFLFILVINNYCIKYICFFGIKQGEILYHELSANRIFTVGLAGFFCVLVMTVNVEKESQDYCQQQKKIIAVWILLGIIILCTGFCGQRRFRTEDRLDMFLCLVMMIVYVIVTCMTDRYFYQQIEKNEKAEFEAEIQGKISYYKELERNQREVYKLYHDMKNHLAMIGNMNENHLVQDYISKCMEKTGQIEGIVQSGNIYADTMLYDKWKSAGELDISFQMLVEENVFDGIEIFDLTVLLGNLLDNAIEALQREVGAEKRMRFKAWTQGNMSLLMVENTCTADTGSDGMELRTSKAEKKYHGFGLKNIDETAKKYHGKVKIGYRDKKFRIIVVLIRK